MPVPPGTRNPNPCGASSACGLPPFTAGTAARPRRPPPSPGSIIEVDSPVNLDGSVAPPVKLEILNPTNEAFAVWKVESLEHEGRIAIPNSHLEHQDPGDVRAGVSLQDANLLKIEVTYPFELKVPFVSGILLETLARFDRDPERLVYYAAGRLPLQSVATVRMQSEVWGEALDSATAAPFGPSQAAFETAVAPPPAEGDGDVADGGDGTGQCGTDGLPLQSPILTTGDEADCSADQSFIPEVDDTLIGGGGQSSVPTTCQG